MFDTSLTEVAASNEEELSIAGRRERLRQVGSVGVQPALVWLAVVVDGQAVDRDGAEL